MRAVLLAVVVLLAGCTRAPDPPDDAAPTNASPTGAPVVPLREAAPAPPLAPPPEVPPTSDAPGRDPRPPVEAPPEEAPPQEELPPATPPPPAAQPPPPEPAPVALSGPGLPVRFQSGADSPDGRRFVSLTIAADQGSFGASVRGVAEATLRIDSLARVANADSTTHEVTIRTAQISDPSVLQARLLLGGTPVDLRSAAPNITLFLSPGALVDIGIEIALASGASGDPLFQRSVILDVR